MIEKDFVHSQIVTKKRGKLFQTVMTGLDWMLGRNYSQWIFYYGEALNRLCREVVESPSLDAQTDWGLRGWSAALQEGS